MKANQELFMAEEANEAQQKGGDLVEMEFQDAEKAID